MSPKRMGRPPKPAAPGQMAPLSIRITAALKTKVQAAAEANGRSFGAEVESRLERSFDADAISEQIAKVIREEWRQTGRIDLEIKSKRRKP
jgi:hypothetical protein